MSNQCPVCKTHTMDDQKDSVLLTIRHSEAYLKADGDTLTEIFGLATPYDAHVAMTLYASLLDDIALNFGQNPLAVLKQYRERLLTTSA